MVVVMVAEVRHVTSDELPAWISTVKTAFLEDPRVSAELATWRASFTDLARARGAFADGRCVATLRTFPTTITVPGAVGTAEITADALTTVSVAATHRRQGLLRTMLSASLTDAYERGETVSILRAAEWPIYGRFGYWPSTVDASYRVRCDRNATLVGDGSQLTVRQITPAEAAEIGPALYQRMRTQCAGHIDRSESQWQRRLGLNGVDKQRELVCVLAVDPAGQAHGLLTWTATEGDGWPADPVDVIVHDLISGSDAGYRTLWDYLIHLDLVTAIRFDDRAADEPLQWLLPDGRLAQQLRTSDATWLRLLDVPAALNARRYAVDSQLTLTVVDNDFGGWAAGTYTLDGGPSHADCRVAPGASADLTLSQRALAGIYLGGYSLRSQQLAGLIDEHASGAVARLASMLHTDRQPWNATAF